ncbi:MAG TPA: hypothetical protein VGF26_06770 [Ramlibacter sp.]
MDRTRRTRNGQRMANRYFADRRGRLSRTAALGALLAVAVLAAAAVGLIGGNTVALAHRGLDTSGQAGRTPGIVRSLVDPPMEHAPMPEVPADADDAQPVETF